MSAIRTAIRTAGGPAEVARRLGVSVQSVCFYRDGRRSFPPELAADLEAAANGAVKRWEMFPHSWHRIWPELVGADGAPAAPTERQEVRDAA